MKIYFLSVFAIVALLSNAGCTVGPETKTPAVAAQRSQAVETIKPGEYPRKRAIEGATLIVHAPQIRSWRDFEHFESLVAIEVVPDGAGEPVVGTATVSGDTQVNMDDHIVIVTNPEVEQVTFSDQAATDRWAEPVKASVGRSRIDIPVDLFVSYLSDDLVDVPTPEGFNTTPPPIHVRLEPAIIVFVNGEAIDADIEGTPLKIIPNASFPIVHDPAAKRYYLLNNQQWLVAPALWGPWTVTGELPAAFSQIPPDSDFRQLKANVPPKSAGDQAPEVILTGEPAELIVIDGSPDIAPITGVGELSYVKNTSSPLFKLGKEWYFLASGRWFRTTQLDGGKWTFVSKLPDEFVSIPADSPVAYIRASVAGTPEARVAVLESMLPRRTSVAKDAQPEIQVTYAGEPQFETIQTTSISRATNTPYDVLLYDNSYYLCYSGVWYIGSTPTGPWRVATEVPDVFYQIPADSPAYAVTGVTVASSSSTVIIYDSTPAYWSGVYIAYGIPVYGTGWYYPPYVYYPYYYPYGHSYGYGSWYNPHTGAYGTTSAWYGPYGGYTYSQGYNPNTGRYGYVETAWDGDTWKSSGETYNPRTGVSTDTTREYKEGKDQLTQKRTIERGDQSIQTKRTRDYDDNWSKVEANTSRGGSYEAERQLNDDGTITGSGTLKTADGRKADISGEASGGNAQIDISGSEGGSGTINRQVGPEGVTRQGEFSKDGESLTTSTVRRGDSTRTTLEGSAGGQAISVSDGLGRTTVGQSAGGDLYAGHDGNVYKRTDDGWQQHTSDGWQQTSRQGTAGDRSYGASSQLNRDFDARRSGYQRFDQRRSYGGAGRRAGGFDGMGGRRGGMGGGRGRGRGGRR